MPAKAKVKNLWQPYEDALRRKQQELFDSYERDKAAGNAQPDDGIQDLADKAASAYSKELNFSLSDGERNSLKLVEEALERVRVGTFGACTNCGPRASRSSRSAAIQSAIWERGQKRSIQTSRPDQGNLT